MHASEMIADWYERQLVAHIPPAPTSVTALVTFYGSASAAANAAGVSAKSMQRYVRFERGERGKDVRNPDARPTTAAAQRAHEGVERAKESAKAQANERAVAAVAAKIQRQGLTVARFAGKMIVSEKARTVDRMPRTDDTHIDGTDLDAFVQAAGRADWNAAAQEWQDAFFGNGDYGGAYTVPGASLPDITALDMEIG